MEGTRDMDKATCAVPTLHLGHCKHAPRYAFTLRGEIISQVCAQHFRGAGVARMLLPMPWEYDRVVDLASGVTVR